MDVVPDTAAAMAALGLTDLSRNSTKLNFLNSPAGVVIRGRIPGMAVHAVHVWTYTSHHPPQPRRCVLCGCLTTAYCKQCATQTGSVRFPVCVTRSVNTSGRYNTTCCFQMMHNNDTLVSQVGQRPKLTTPEKMGALVDARAKKRAKAVHDVADEPEPADDALPVSPAGAAAQSADDAPPVSCAFSAS